MNATHGEQKPRTRSAAYRAYVASQTVSNFGTFMEYTALYWLVTRISGGDPTQLAIVSGAQFLPLLVLSRMAGRLVSRYPRRRMLVITQYAQMSVSLLLAMPLLLLDWANTWAVCAAALLLGCVHVVDAPARQMFLQDLVGKDELRRGVGIYSTSLGLARIGGPALAGILIAGAGEGLVFLVNAISYLAVVAALTYIGRHRDALIAATKEIPPAVKGARVGWLRSLPIAVWPALILAGLLGGFAYQFHVTGPLMVSAVFAEGSVTYGLVGTCTAIGAVLGSFVSSRRSHPTAGEFVGWAALFGVAALFAAVAPNPVWFCAAMFVIGTATALFTTTTVVFIQRSTSEHEQGPALASYNAAYMGFVPAGGIVVGLIAAALGVRWGVALPAAALLFAAAITATYLRCARSPRSIEPNSTPTDRPVVRQRG